MIVILFETYLLWLWYLENNVGICTTYTWYEEIFFKKDEKKAYFCGFSHTPIFHRVCGVVTHFRTFYTCQSLFLCSLAEKFALEAKNNRMIVEEKGGENEADETNTEEEDDIKLCDDDKNVDINVAVVGNLPKFEA